MAARERKRGRRHSSLASVSIAIVVIGVVGAVAGIVYNLAYSHGVFHYVLKSASKTSGKTVRPPARKTARTVTVATASRIATPPTTTEKETTTVKVEPRPVQPVTEVETPPPSPEPKEPALVTLEEAQRVFQQGSAIWVDARSKGNYEYGHVPGAINIPASQFKEIYQWVEKKLPKNERILVYCSSANCDDSLLVLRQMMEIGYRPANLLYFKDGWNAWEMHDLPQEKGAAE